MSLESKKVMYLVYLWVYYLVCFTYVFGLIFIVLSFLMIYSRALEHKCSMDNYCNLHRDNSIEDKGGFALMGNKIYNQLAYTKGLDSKG